jgi:hypothetical protein
MRGAFPGAASVGGGKGIMVKKPDPPVIDEPGSGGERVIEHDRGRSLAADREPARDDSDLEVRGRRYRIGVQDGFVGIWELRSGEQVGTFMEDAFSAAWARYLELEQSRSVNRFVRQTGEFLAHRWYAIVVVVLGALTVVYLRAEDPALPPTGAGVRAAEAPRAVEPIADLGSTVAGTLDPSLAAPRRTARPAEEGRGRQREKKDREAGNEPPSGGEETATPGSSASDTSGAGTSGGTSGGPSGGNTGDPTGGNPGDGSGGEPPPPPEDPPTTAQPPPPPDP